MLNFRVEDENGDPGLLERFGNWLLDELRSLALWVWDKITQAIASLIEMIPVPDFLTSLPSYTMPPAVSYFLDIVQFQFAITILVAAYIARFFVRRLPFIG